MKFLFNITPPAFTTMSIHPGIPIGIILMAGALVFVHREMNRMFAEEKARSRSPFKEKLLRPPGESLRLKIEQIRDDIMQSGFVLAVAMVVPSTIIMLVSRKVWIVGAVIWAIAAIVGYRVAFLQLKKLKGLRAKLRDYRLGFDGERYVAEKLSELSAQGYRIFHDFVVDMKPGGDETNFNIDHIVVGPNGVFAIETKTWRQPNGELPDGKERHEVTASHDELILPLGFRARTPARQAKKNAEELSKWLTGSSPHTVPVYPIVVMPGWFVTDDKTGTVPVLSGKPVAKMLIYQGGKGELNADQVRSISDRIEAHCRDVEAA